MSRVSLPSSDAAGTLSMKSIVFFTRANSSSIVVSVSSNFGGSMPASRAMEFFAKSLASWICLANGSMSGASRASTSTLVSKLRALAFATAFLHDVQELRQRLLEDVVAHRVHRNLHGDFPF